MDHISQIQRLRAVSYTHLDVYKRQSYSFSSKQNTWRRATWQDSWTRKKKSRLTNGEWPVKKSQRTGKEGSLSLIHRVAEYEAIQKLSCPKHYPIDRLCKYLNDTRSAYYRWGKYPKSNNELRNERQSTEIQRIHHQHPDMGYRRIRDELDGHKGIHVKMCIRDRCHSGTSEPAGRLPGIHRSGTGQPDHCRKLVSGSKRLDRWSARTFL